MPTRNIAQLFTPEETFCINIHAKYIIVSVITPAVRSELNICGYLTFFVNYIKFSCSVRNTREMYAAPESIYLVYISFVFCICSLIQIMGKQKLKLSRQNRSSYIKKRRSHTTPSQTLHSCLASISQGTPSTNLQHLFSTNSKHDTTQTTSDIFPIQTYPSSQFTPKIQN